MTHPSQSRTRRMQDLTVDEHILTLPLVWGDAEDERTIDVFAAVVTRDGGEDLPYLVFLQGGPGHEAPRPFHSPSTPAWMPASCASRPVTDAPVPLAALNVGVVKVKLAAVVPS